MPQNAIERRREAYFQLSSRIAQLNNAQLSHLLEANAANTSNSGWGVNQTLVFGQSKVFVKRIPVTDLEYNNLFSTRNLYDLPTYCNYGLGSTGIGVFRELITHIKTTHWVLEGEHSMFPLMYHYRILPSTELRSQVDADQLQRYVACWGNSENAGQYLLDRAIASRELVLFLEHIPYILGEWLRDNPDKLQKPLCDLRKTIDFLSAKGIIHFDAHFFNALTDGEQTYLTDFGLVLDRSFDLTEKEKAFFDRNALYDYGEVLRNLGYLMRLSYDLCSESDRLKIISKYGIKDGLKPYQISLILLENIQQIQADGDIKLGDFYVDSVLKYRNITALMQNFFADMVDNPRKDTEFPDVELQYLLKKTNFLP
ncbi:hypothetical protein ACQ4N7_20770 [Nodosilinea sp. AN01ver1]|uniref:hypothetical protein n=1 Tax=Nodosilinea sp. AN01ver1 TaxID=3423362 RepID=UPI003D315B8A